MSRIMRLIIALAALCAISTPAIGQSTEGKTLYVFVTVDWEGHGLDGADLRAMRELREDFPEVPFVHYLNPAYFTKPHANARQIEAEIDAVLLPGDEHGLHIHGWQSLFEAAGVPHRRAPNWSPDGHTLTDGECTYDCGHSIPITAYTGAELQRVIAYSIDLLVSHGYDRPVSFRAGGWMSSAPLSAALVAEGITSDSSAVPTSFLSAKLGHYNMYDWLADIWSGTSSTTQPYRVSTPAGSLWQVPDNGALADYVTARDMFDVLNDNLRALYQSSTATARYVVIGFHQETAAEYGDRIAQVLAAIRSYNQDPPIPIVYRTLEIGR